jgi:hypothetical protein
MLHRYCLSDFEMVPVAPIITGITFAFTFHLRWIPITSSLYFKIYLASLLMTFLSTGIATSINMHVQTYFSRIIMSGSLLAMPLSVCTFLIPQYSHLAFFICYYWLWYMYIPGFFVQLHACLLAYVEVYLCTHSIMPYYILFFCHYWACWYYMLYCLIMLLAKSTFTIPLCV